MDDDSLECTVCSEVCKRAIIVSCCNARACRACALKQITRDRKCWREDCGESLATKDIQNDEKTRDNIEMLNDVSLIQCSLCGEVCKRGISLRCCGARACRECGVKKITSTRKCWDESCGESQATSDLTNDNVLRAAVDNFKKNDVLDWEHVKILKKKAKKVVAKDNSEADALPVPVPSQKQPNSSLPSPVPSQKQPNSSLPAPVPTQKQPARIDKRKNDTGNKNGNMENGEMDISKKSRDSFDDLPCPVPSQAQTGSGNAKTVSGNDESVSGNGKNRQNVKVKQDLLNSLIQQHKSLNINLKKGNMKGRDRSNALKRLKELNESIKKTKSDIEKINKSQGTIKNSKNDTEKINKSPGPIKKTKNDAEKVVNLSETDDSPAFLILPNNQSILQKKLDSTSPFVMAVIGLEFLVEIPRGSIHCQLCGHQEKLASIFEHLQSPNHRSNYIQKFFPALHKKITDQKTSKESNFRVLEKATEKIEASRGRLRPITVASEDAYNKNLEKIRSMIQDGQHFSENDSPTIPYNFDSLSDPFPDEEISQQDGKRSRDDDERRSRDDERRSRDDERRSRVSSRDVDRRSRDDERMSKRGNQPTDSRRPNPDDSRVTDRVSQEIQQFRNKHLEDTNPIFRYQEESVKGVMGAYEEVKIWKRPEDHDERPQDRSGYDQGAIDNFSRRPGSDIGRESRDNERFPRGQEAQRFGRFEERNGRRVAFEGDGTREVERDRKRDDEREMFSRRGDTDMYSRRDGGSRRDRDGDLHRNGDRDENDRRDGDQESRSEREMAREKDKLRREKEKMGMREERRNLSPERKRKRSVSPYSAAVENFKRFKQAEDVMLEGIKRKNQIFERRPEDHPKYPDEWRTFWHKRYSEVQAEGKDPNSHDYNTEWVPFWKKRVTDLIDEEVMKNQKSLMKQYGLNSVQPPKRTDDQFKDIDPMILEQKGEDRNRSSSDRRKSDHHNRSSTNDDHNRSSTNDDHNRSSTNDNHNRSSINRNKSRSPRRSSTRKPLSRDPSDVQLIPALRLLSTLETDLETLGPEVNQCLVRAMTEEQEKEGGSHAMLDDPKFLDLMETSKGKLNDIIQSGLLDEAKEHVVKLCIDHLTKIVKYGKREVERSVSPAASVISVHSEVSVQSKKEDKPRETPVDPKAMIAESIATVLMFFKCGDILEEQLEMVVEMVLRKTAKDDKVTPAGQLANQFLSTVSPTESLITSLEVTKSQDYSEEVKTIPEKQAEPNIETNDVFNDLTDDELILLLGSFKALSKTEKLNLVSHMKNLEKVNPMKVKMLRSRVGSQKAGDVEGVKSVNNYSFDNGNSSVDLEARSLERRGNDGFRGDRWGNNTSGGRDNLRDPRNSDRRFFN